MNNHGPTDSTCFRKKFFKKCNSLHALISLWSVLGDLCVKSGQLNPTKSLKWFPKKWLCNYHNGQNLEHWLVTTPNAGDNVEQHKLTPTAGKTAKWCSHFGRLWWFLTKLNVLLSYLTVVLLDIYSKELKTGLF